MQRWPLRPSSASATTATTAAEARLAAHLTRQPAGAEFEWDDENLRGGNIREGVSRVATPAANASNYETQTSIRRRAVAPFCKQT